MKAACFCRVAIVVGSIAANFGVVFAQEKADGPLVASLDPAPPASETGPRSEVEILRCHLREKRIVVRHQGMLFVVHEGETLPGGNGRVERIDAAGVLLTEGTIVRGTTGDPVSVPRRIIAFTVKPDGRMTRHEYQAEDADPSSSAALMRADIRVSQPGSPLTTLDALIRGSARSTPIPKSTKRVSR